MGEVADPGRVNRFGMRYVNELADPRVSDEDPRALAQVLSEELVAVAASLARPLIASLSELRVREPFGELTVRHGMTQPGRCLLDLDAHDDAAGSFDADRLMSTADAFHSRIEAVFAWSLQPDYLASLSEPDKEVDQWARRRFPFP